MVHSSRFHSCPTGGKAATAVQRTPGGSSSARSFDGWRQASFSYPTGLIRHRVRTDAEYDPNLRRRHTEGLQYKHQRLPRGDVGYIVFAQRFEMCPQ
jgi:hypothetical protein